MSSLEGSGRYAATTFLRESTSNGLQVAVAERSRSFYLALVGMEDATTGSRAAWRERVCGRVSRRSRGPGPRWPAASPSRFTTSSKASWLWRALSSLRSQERDGGGLRDTVCLTSCASSTTACAQGAASSSAPARSHRTRSRLGREEGRPRVRQSVWVRPAVRDWPGRSRCAPPPLV